MSFTINLLTDTETSYRDFDSILADLPDNLDKLIPPRYIRDAVFSSWVTSVFKPTNGYIGVDAVDPSNRDIKLKMLFGKRKYITDILDTTLLTSDTDIFFFNTRLDTESNIKTKLSFLAGQDISLHSTAPYINAYTLGTTGSISYDFVGPNNVNLTSTNDYIIIDSITFSGITATPVNNDILMFNNGVLGFEQLTITSASLGATGATLSILSNPANVNGYSLEFTDLRPLPVGFNDNLPIASTNEDVSMYSMLLKIIYPYLPPLVSLELLSPYESGYIEIGNNVLIGIKYTITKRTENIAYINLENMISSSNVCPIKGNGFITKTGTYNGILTPGSVVNYFKLTVIDEHVPPTTVSATASITEIYPYFHGFSDLLVSNSLLYELTKIIQPESTKSINIMGTGDYYFLFDSTYSDLTDILDGNLVSVPFTNGTAILNSPNGYWGTKTYKWYKISVNEVNPSIFYQFII
jgi:hypothetical protein